jgi:hypothetical protein
MLRLKVFFLIFLPDNSNFDEKIVISPGIQISGKQFILRLLSKNPTEKVK